MTIENSNTSKNAVTRSSLYDLAAKAEGSLEHLGVLIDQCSDKLANMSVNESPNLLLAEATIAQTFLDAAGMYVRTLEQTVEALYKQAWSMPKGEDS